MASRRTALWPLIACAVVLACFTTVVNADFYDKSSGIVDLNSKNFDELVTKGGGVWLVEFYAPCKRVSATTRLRIAVTFVDEYNLWLIFGQFLALTIVPSCVVSRHHGN